jgi:hypothetical protein
MRIGAKQRGQARTDYINVKPISMKHFFSISALLLLSLSITAQGYKPLPEFVFPEQDSNTKYHTVQGYRHGVSFFPKARHYHVEYEAGDKLTFDKFHTACVSLYWMERYAEKYPDLVDIYEVAKSYEGRPIIQMTITNKNTGLHTDKPAAFFEGNRHSGEVTSTESVLWLMQHLLDNYGKDPQITKIVDTKTIYLRPINNPDGHNLYMHTAQSNRSTVRPYDNDGDGLLDEDSPDDIDGDGIILQMRWVDTINGNMIIDPRDPTGRNMIRVPAGQGRYLTSAEGIDNDGDGRINEDGIGGLDLHRNYAENWRPMPRDEATGRGWTQGGAGEYPLSEIETRSVVTFLLSHPHVYIVNSMDTRVPMHLRPPSTSASEERMYPEDLEWYKHFDELGNSITGYGRAGDVYMDYGRGRPLFGHGPDFGYWYYGSIWYGDELWDGGRITKDYNGDGEIDILDRFAWDDQENDGMAFSDWTPARHPDLGDIEIGGWDPKFFSQNPPAKFLEPWAANQALFNLAMVKHLPELEWENIDVKRTKSYRSDSTDYQITITFRNSGQLPTALKQADLVKIVREDMIVVDFDIPRDGSTIFGIIPEEIAPGRRRTGALPQPVQQRRLSASVGYTEGGKTNSVIYNIRVYGDATVTGRASVVTTRAGILEPKEFVVR